MMDSRSALKKIIKFVVGVHLLLMLIGFVEIKKKPKKIVITSRVMRENFRAPPVVTLVAAKKNISQTKVTAQVQPAKKAAAKPANKPAKPVQTASATQKPKLAKELPKIEPVPQEPKSKSIDIVLPKAIAQLNVEKMTIIEDGDLSEVSNAPYLEYFSSEIKSRLQLNAGAFVHLEVTINPEGKVVKVLHKKSSDPFNKDYIIENVRQMQFSPFFGEIARDSEYTFVITLEGET